MGGGVDELKSVAKALEAPKATESDAKAPRKRFVDKSHFVALIDLSRLVVSGLKLAAEQTKLPFDVKVLDKMNLPSSFISYSLSFEANSVRSQLELPAMQFQNIAKTALTLQSQ